MSRIVAIEILFDDGSKRIYSRDVDTYLCILESDKCRDIAMTGSRERHVVMAKILEALTTERILETNKVLERLPAGKPEAGP